MESNLPQKYKDGLFSKIKNFFLRLFGGNDNHSTSIDKTVTENITENVKTVSQGKQKNTIDIIREENQKNREKEDLLLQIEKNPNLINDWSIEKLLKLEKFLDEEIAEYDKNIERLKGQAV